MKKTVTSNTTTKDILVLLDMHAILHRAYHALPDFASSKGEPTGALYGLCNMLFVLYEKFKPTHIAACFDLPKPTYRHHAYDAYKAGRAKTDDALVEQLKKARDVVTTFGIPIFDHEGFEADDMLGTIVEQINGAVPIIIASGDMDTLQLTATKGVSVFTLKKGIKDTILYDAQAVRERFGFDAEYLPDYKGLRGDPSDNIIGVKGIGEKTATTLISTYKTIEHMYQVLEKLGVETFAKQSDITPRLAGILHDNKEDAVFSKMLATIRRDAPIDFSLDKAVFAPLERVEVIKSLFADLEFRSLTPRIATVFGGIKTNTHLGRSEVEYDEEAPLPEQKVELLGDEDHRLVKQAGIMLWILDSSYTNPSWDEIATYTGKNTIQQACVMLEEKLAQIPALKKIYETIEKPLMEVVGHMEKIGIALDVRVFDTLREKYTQESIDLEKKIHELAGGEFNINSPKQLGEVLYQKLGLGTKVKKTAGGAQSTKETELVKIIDDHPIVELVLEYRELQKLLGTYIEVIPKLIGEDGRLHAQFLQTGAATGRMASLNPNLQNIPIKTERGRAIRDAFVAAPGCMLVECDYSQIELRVAAFLSEDPLMMDIFKHGRDVHTEVAAQVFKVARDEVTKDMRRKAKVINFGILYGMGVNALRANLGKDTTRAEAQVFYDQYFATFTRLASYLDEVTEFAKKNGYTETFFGRRRYFEGLKSKLPFIRAAAERMAINAPIQGTEADAIKIAMIDIYNELVKGNEDSIRLLLQIHDSLIFEIKKDAVKTYVPKVISMMEAVLPVQKTHGVPILVEGAVGPHWGDMEDYNSLLQ